MKAAVTFLVICVVLAVLIVIQSHNPSVNLQSVLFGKFIEFAAGLAFFIFYVLPSGIAIHRKHPHSGLITAVNLVLGWTVIGWIGAFVWAFTTVRR